MSDIKGLLDVIREWIDQQEADGCQECAFTEHATWEMPCRECKRNCKDYWRRRKREAETEIYMCPDCHEIIRVDLHKPPQKCPNCGRYIGGGQDE